MSLQSYTGEHQPVPQSGRCRKRTGHAGKGAGEEEEGNMEEELQEKHGDKKTQPYPQKKFWFYLFQLLGFFHLW